MKTFQEYISEEVDGELELTKDEIVDVLDILKDDTETDLEEELIDLITTLVEEDIVKEYDAIIDLLEEFVDDDDIEDAISEAQRPLYKRRGYVRDKRTGRIRKRGQTGKPLDRKRSRIMKKARKKHRMSFKRGQRKTRKTKKRLGQWK